MDLTLSLGYQQQNDNKAIILTDTTSNFSNESVTHLTDTEIMTAGIMYEIVARTTYDFTSVYTGAADNTIGTRFVTLSTATAGQLTLGVGDEVKAVTPTIPEITAITLDTTVTGVDNTPTAKNQVDLYALESGPFVVQSELVYTITSVELDGDTTAALLPDGLYALEYNMTYVGLDSTGVTPSDYSRTELLEVTILVYGQVKVAVYDKYRQIPAWCNCEDKDAMANILETTLCGAHLDAIISSAYIAKTEELINMLIVLDNMVTNGSNIYY